MYILECGFFARVIKRLAKDMVRENGLKPLVAILKANNDKASETYIKRKRESMEECGIATDLWTFDDSETVTERMIKVIEELNSSEEVTGIIVQMPTYENVDVFKVLESIDPRKDIDCLTSRNMGLLVKGEPYVKPATPRGVVALLEKATELKGKNVLIIGRSEIVGLPLSIMLQQEDCTVTLAHSKSTYDVNSYDIVISAIGVGESIIVNNENAICIDVGINFKMDNDGKRKQIGDFDINNTEFNCHSVTAPKGGIGILTSAVVCLNSVELALKIKGEVN